MVNRKSCRLHFFLLLVFLFAAGGHAGAQELSLEAVKALDEWRWGVIALNDGLPGKALLSMEQALTLDPVNPQIQEWLGRAYWRYGMEDSALKVWSALAEDSEASSVLINKAEQLRRRLSGEEEIPVDDEWIPLISFKGREDGVSFFKRPGTARSAGDGSGGLLITSYVGGEIIRTDANGALVERYEGGVEGFDRPFDVLDTGDGRLLVTEFQADRISVLSLDKYRRGYRIDSWGSSGREENSFLGPQYMALSPDGAYVYVSDWGNRRVAKWDLNGNHVLNIEARGRFSGFEGVSGIACQEERVFVADSLRKTVDVFDTSGNYLGPLITEGLNAPEGMTLYKGSLLIADGNRILRVDLESGALTQEADLGEGEHLITSVFPDENGNLAVADFNGDRIVLLTPLSTLYGGLDVTLNSVRADAYPDIAVDLTVKDRTGHPIRGLDATNFRVFDGEQLLGTPELDWTSSTDTAVSIAAVADLSGSAQDVRFLMKGAGQLASALETGDSLSLAGAGSRTAVEEILPGESAQAFERLTKEAVGSRLVEWDEALRLAATDLVARRERKAVAAFVNRLPSAGAFDRYGLVETARLMANNGIVFYPVYADPDLRSPELDYIAAQTGGSASYMLSPEGSGQIVRQLRSMAAGRYTIVWRTPHPAGFGREFLPVGVEVIYLKKSGRDESGSFAPLD